jgi:hypothetical protein
VHQRLQKPHEGARHDVAVRFAEDLALLLRAHARRLQEQAQAAVGLDAVRHVVDHLAPAAQVVRLARQLEQRLGVVPGDGGFAHY